MGNMPYHEITASIVLLRYDTNGILVWGKEIRGVGEDKGKAMIATSDGGFFITASTENGVGTKDILNLKLDANGEVEWMRVVGLALQELPVSVIELKGGGYAITL